jgi:hypothetical protein
MQNESIPFDKAALLNNVTYIDYYNRLRQLAISMFEWEGFPDSVNVRFLERTLFTLGRAIFINDESMGYLTLKCTYAGNINVYEEPVAYTAYSINYNKVYDRDNCVIIRNNFDELPTEMTIQLFARRLYEVERTLDTNIKAQKTPVLVKCDEKQRLTLKNLYMQYDGNYPFIFGDKSLDSDLFKVLKTDAPFVADKLMLYKHDIMNECLSFLGINNANTDKKERLIVSEAESNTQMVQMAAETMLKTRRIAAEEINKKYNLNVTVRLKVPTELQEESNEEGDEE